MIAFAVALAGASVIAAELKPRTVQDFERYAKATEARIDREVRGSQPFLWIDRQSPAERDALLRRLRAGEVVVSRLQTRQSGREIDIHDGLVHHWVGSVLMPGATIERVKAMVLDYNRYDQIYKPIIRRSRLTGRQGDHATASMQLYAKKVVTVYLNADFDIWFAYPTPQRMHARSYAVRIAEVENVDTPQEREKPVGRDSGFLWRFHNYCSYEERDGGVIMQCESVSLTRSIPAGFAWLIRPFVSGIPRESLAFTLGAARKWVAAN